MPNSLQSSDIASPASRRATNCSLSSITKHSFQGIITPSPEGESVTYVSGTMCYLNNALGVGFGRALILKEPFGDPKKHGVKMSSRNFPVLRTQPQGGHPNGEERKAAYRENPRQTRLSGR